VLLLVAGTVVAAGLGFWWRSTHDPRVPFLSASGPARWIVYPRPAELGVHRLVELEARFRHTFVVREVGTEAMLSFRAMRRATLWINGHGVPLPEQPEADWKHAKQVDVASYLRRGDNEIEVGVTSARGPPALALRLVAADGGTETDDTWSVSLAGASWCRATLATAPLEPSRAGTDRGLPGTRASLRARWPTLLGFGALAAIAVVVVRLGGRRWTRRAEGAGLGALLVPVLLVAGLWGALFWNNLPSLTRDDGFDASGHLRYVRYVSKHRQVPSADVGWETYQPPLYYALSALTLEATGVRFSSPAMPSALRLQSLALGVVQLALVFASLRLVFPRSPRRPVLGLILAAFLPMQLYLFQYPTNEVLAATLAAASIFAALRVLDASQPSLGSWAALGACLGAALLAKVSALLVIAPVLVAVAGPLVLERGFARRRLGGIALALGVSLCICGPWLVGNLRRFGRPFVRHAPGADPGLGASWWQDPGYLTVDYFLEFGRSLTHPLFSAFHGLADGVYSTLFGDGLIGGHAAFWAAPPWRYDLMAVGYGLALLPTLAVAVGAVAAFVRFVERPRAKWFVLNGVAGGALVALVAIVLQDASYAQAKAFFVSAALVPFCAFGAWGLDRLLGHGGVRYAVVAIWLGVWAINAYATFWIPRGSPAASARLGRLHAAAGDREGLAEALLRETLAADPENASAHLGMAVLLEGRGRHAEAMETLRRRLASDPSDVEAREMLAYLLNAAGENDEAVREHRRVLEIDPDFSEAHYNLGLLLEPSGRRAEAIDHYREALRVRPQFGEAHIALGRALEGEEGIRHLAVAARLDPESGPLQRLLGDALVEAGRSAEAVGHFRDAILRGADTAYVRSRLAWILATHPDPDVRSPAEAIRHARRAATLTRRRDVGALDTLAAAFAAAGRFEPAVSTAEAALDLEPDGEKADAIRERIDLYRRERPFYEPERASRTPPPRSRPDRVIPPA